MHGSEREQALSSRVQEFLEVFRKGEAFAQDLLKENERLRSEIAGLSEKLQSASLQASKEGSAAAGRANEEHESLKVHLREIEKENEDFARRYVEVEEENNALANLYVASFQLHSTLNFDEVINIVMEIIINLIGAERFAIYLLDESGEELKPAAHEGFEGRSPGRVRVGQGIIGEVARSGDRYLLEAPSPGSGPPEGDERTPIVCIPLKIHDHVMGTLVIYSFLAQKKKQMTRVDHELFSMLAGHAATALFGAKLFSQSERKLSTIQGFLDLLIKKER